MIKVLSLFDGMACGYQAFKQAGFAVSEYHACEVDKYAMQIAMKNHPDIIQHGDVNNYHPDRAFDYVIGGSPCFVKDTKIVCKNEIKSIQDVRVGDLVLTHRGFFRKVLKTGNAVKEIKTVLSQGGVPIDTTDNHPFYARKRHKVWNNEKRSYKYVFEEPEWVNVKNLTNEHYVGTPISLVNRNPLKLTNEECFILGLYLGDGHTRKDYRISENRPNDRHWQLILSIGSHQVDVLKSKLTVNYSCYQHTDNVHRFVFSNKRLVEISEKYIGCGSENKSISKIIIDLPKRLLTSFLNGYEFSDGSVCDNTFKATTISKQLVNTMTLLIAKLYKTTCTVIYTKRPNKTVIQGRVVNQKNTWVIMYRKYHTEQSRAWVIDGIIWNPVKGVKTTDLVSEVYNIEVEDDNSYVADCRIVHNCQSFSAAGKGKGFEDPRGQLFWQYVRILAECKVLNPNVKFLLENVKMKKKDSDIISCIMGVEPVIINSALLAAQNRVRAYWCNWKVEQPEDRGIYLKDIIEEGVVDRDKSYCIDANYYKGGSLKNYLEKSRRQIVLSQSENRLYVVAERGRRLTQEGKRDDKNGTIVRGYEPSTDGKSFCLTTVLKDNYLAEGIVIRKLTPTECEKLQTLPCGYTEGVSATQRYRMVGNGWTVSVIEHILRASK